MHRNMDEVTGTRQASMYMIHKHLYTLHTVPNLCLPAGYFYLENVIIFKQSAFVSFMYAAVAFF